MFFTLLILTYFSRTFMLHCLRTHILIVIFFIVCSKRIRLVPPGQNRAYQTELMLFLSH